MNQVAARLKAMITAGNDGKSNPQLSNEQPLDLNNTSSSANDSLHGESPQVIQHFNHINAMVEPKKSLPRNRSGKDVDVMMNTMDGNLNGDLYETVDENDSSEEIGERTDEKDSSKDVDEIVDTIFKMTNEGKSDRQIVSYLENASVNSQETIDWLSNNQNNSNNIFLFGYLNWLL